MVVPEERRRRTYWNGVLARAEVESSYTPRRPLWQRERTGHYFPSHIGVRVAGEAGAEGTFVPLAELLECERLDPDGFVPSAPAARRPEPGPAFAARLVDAVGE